ncbi:restriction endonuclease subunit S [Jeotgalibacillus marinus]|uniref:Restriction endonuclease subunit S n=1 Tax=Jeotgalibacillus marinus TaxID=86667 RepID=A0ABV3Q769_9BACL
MTIINLQEIATVVQGTNFSRVETNKDHVDAKEVKLLTLREFNQTLGLPYRLGEDKKTSIWVQKDKLHKLTFTTEDRLVVHLLSQKAAVLPKQYEGLLIPSNFVVLDFHQPIDAKFMEWYFNEHPFIRRQLLLSTQGAIVSSLSIKMLREIEVSLPPVETQVLMGAITHTFKKKKTFIQERMNLEEQLIHHKIMEKMEEYL